jgi:hypothetical protein
VEAWHFTGAPRRIGGVEHHERTDWLFAELIFGVYAWQEGFSEELAGEWANV